MQAKEAVTGEAPVGKVTSLCTYILKNNNRTSGEHEIIFLRTQPRDFNCFFYCTLIAIARVYHLYHLTNYC